ncbi:MAG: transposase [Anaerolineae bacterium]
MPRRDIPLISGEYYHVYNRGNNRQDIFFERANYIFFVRRLRKYLIGPTTFPWVTIVAYCLMPNHFHLLVQLHDALFSRRMQHHAISYTKAINERYQRVGALYQGQFRAIHIDSNDYLLHLSRYIHLNPVAAHLVQRPEDWEYSSFREYVGLRQGTLIDPGIVLGQFHDTADYSQFVEAYRPEDLAVINHLLIEE